MWSQCPWVSSTLRTPSDRARSSSRWCSLAASSSTASPVSVHRSTNTLLASGPTTILWISKPSLAWWSVVMSASLPVGARTAPPAQPQRSESAFSTSKGPISTTCCGYLATESDVTYFTYPWDLSLPVRVAKLHPLMPTAEHPEDDRPTAVRAGPASRRGGGAPAGSPSGKAPRRTTRCRPPWRTSRAHGRAHGRSAAPVPRCRGTAPRRVVDPPDRDGLRTPQLVEHGLGADVHGRVLRLGRRRSVSPAGRTDQPGGDEVVQRHPGPGSGLQRSDLRGRHPVDGHDHPFTGGRPPYDRGDVVAQLPDADPVHGGRP